MNASSSFTGYVDEVSELDWQMWMDYAGDQQRFPQQRHACSNPACSAITDAVFCRPACREAVEGPDHEDPEDLENTAAAVFSSTGAPLPALPEAPVSLNTFVTMAGRQVQVTLRGSDLPAVLSQMEALLQRYPVEQALERSAAISTTPHCPAHGPMKRSTKGKGWYCATRLSDGTWCRERRHE